MTATPPRLVLGSSSPYRAEILKRLGLPFEVATADIDEKAIRHPDPAQLTLEIAMAKNVAVHQKLARAKRKRPVVITADSVVVFKGEIREKPNNPEQARAFLESYSECIVEVVTSVVVTRGGPRDTWYADSDSAFVHYGRLNPAAITGALARGTALNTSGALVVEDPELKPYVRAIHGAQDTIEGLSLALVVPMLHKIGFALL